MVLLQMAEGEVTVWGEEVRDQTRLVRKCIGGERV
jgi:hypothetical protein